MTRRSKHKRGERGSVKEVVSAKRANMAATEDSENTEVIEEETNMAWGRSEKQDKEPTLGDLKELLVDIQISRLKIARDHAEL